jgi:hypothetical protein
MVQWRQAVGGAGLRRVAARQGWKATSHDGIWGGGDGAMDLSLLILMVVVWCGASPEIVLCRLQ